MWQKDKGKELQERKLVQALYGDLVDMVKLDKLSKKVGLCVKIHPSIQRYEVIIHYECKLPPNNDRIDCGDKTKTLGPKLALFLALTKWFWCLNIPSITVMPLKVGRNNDESDNGDISSATDKTNEENATIASGIWVESRLQCRSPINTVSCLYATTKSKVNRKLTLFKTII